MLGCHVIISSKFLQVVSGIVMHGTVDVYYVIHNGVSMSSWNLNNIINIKFKSRYTLHYGFKNYYSPTNFDEYVE